MASEDSDEVVSGFSPIHDLGDLRDLDETIDRQMAAGGDELHTSSELLEVRLLGAAHRMLAEEWNDRLQKILLTSPYDVAKHVLPKVVVATVRDDNAHAEELTNCFEARDAPRRPA